MNNESHHGSFPSVRFQQSLKGTKIWKMLSTSTLIHLPTLSGCVVSKFVVLLKNCNPFFVPGLRRGTGGARALFRTLTVWTLQHSPLHSGLPWDRQLLESIAEEIDRSNTRARWIDDWVAEFFSSFLSVWSINFESIHKTGLLTNISTTWTSSPKLEV